jgi:electron transfer flavoprotein alpha subunit
VAPDVIGLEPPDLAHSARVVRAPVAVPKQPRIEVRASQDANPAEIDLCEADVVIAAGRGIGSQENTRFVQELATLLGGSVGATRVVVDLGWLPSAAQVGQTGKTVKPRVYVACGISGATQHTMGMKESGSIVAINTDPAAPIFKIADLALQADVQQLLPVLTERCRRELEAT